MDFGDDRELLSYVISEQKDCKFSYCFLLEKDDSSWKYWSSLLKLVKKGSRKPRRFDYSHFVFEEQIIDIAKGLEIIANLFLEKKLIIPKYDSMDLESSLGLTFIPSNREFNYFVSQYASRLYRFNVKQDKRGQRSHRELFKKGLPYYPDLSEAISHLFDLQTERFTSSGEGYVLIPDYRARINVLKIIFSKAELKIDTPEIKCENLLMTVFAKSGTQRKTLVDIKVSDEPIDIDVGFQPDAMNAVLFTHKDNLKIDEKEFSHWRSGREDVFVERPQEEIISLLRSGESQTLEYKYEIDTDKAKNEFIESIISFLNTNNGIILIGVDDEGNALGTGKTIEDVQKMIHDNCDPPPTNITIDEKKIDGKTILIMEIPEGDNKPYQSKRTKQWYIRHNANDMVMERSELLDIMTEQSTTRYPVSM